MFAYDATKQEGGEDEQGHAANPGGHHAPEQGGTGKGREL